MSKTVALRRLSAGFTEQLMGNIIRKEPMSRRFPKNVGFQRPIRANFDFFKRTA
jgi:hypothetical protein